MQCFLLWKRMENFGYQRKILHRNHFLPRLQLLPYCTMGNKNVHHIVEGRALKIP